MWEISSDGQILSFLYAIVTGFLFCLIYDFFKAFRLTFNHKDLTVFFEDIFYFLIIGIISLIFFLVFTGGEIRIFILLGFVIGFYLWKITFSVFVVYALRQTLNFFKWIFNLLKIKIFKFLGVFCGISFKFKNFIKNIQNRLKKGLKKGKSLLYTKQE